MKIAPEYEGSYLTSNVTEDDEYATMYFPEVLEGLKKRRADAMVSHYCDFEPVMEVWYDFFHHMYI